MSTHRPRLPPALPWRWPQCLSHWASSWQRQGSWRDRIVMHIPLISTWTITWDTITAKAPSPGGDVLDPAADVLDHLGVLATSQSHPSLTHTWGLKQSSHILVISFGHHPNIPCLPWGQERFSSRASGPELRAIRASSCRVVTNIHTTFFHPCPSENWSNNLSTALCSQRTDNVLNTLYLLSADQVVPMSSNSYPQRCKKTTFLHEQGLSQKNVTQKSAQITTNLICDKTA